MSARIPFKRFPVAARRTAVCVPVTSTLLRTRPEGLCGSVLLGERAVSGCLSGRRAAVPVGLFLKRIKE
jgi:hypothetical protein